MSTLLPPGIESLADLPYTIADAIVIGTHFLKFEELPKDERPPRRIWLDEDKLSAHWDRVDRERKEKFGIDGKKPIESDGPVQENDAAKDLIQGL